MIPFLWGAPSGKSLETGRRLGSHVDGLCVKCVIYPSIQLVRRKEARGRWLCEVLVHVTSPCLEENNKWTNQITTANKQTTGEVGCSTSVWKPGLSRTPTWFLQRLLTQLPFFQIWRLLMGILGKEGFPPLLLPSPVLPDSLEIDSVTLEHHYSLRSPQATHRAEVEGSLCGSEAA